MKKLKLLLLSFLLTTTVYAVNTVGYVQIKEIKAWTTAIDVYLIDNQEHGCSGGHKTRFLIDANKPHHVSFILSAFAANKSVSLSYGCDTNGYPRISGIRMK